MGFIWIYDLKKEKLIVEDMYLNNTFSKNMLLIDDTANNCFRILDFKTYRRNPEIFDMKFNSVEMVQNGLENTYIVSVDGKYGVYQKDVGIVIEPEYDKIISSDSMGIMLLQKDGKNYIIFGNPSDATISEVKDWNVEDKLLYVINENETQIYMQDAFSKEYMGLQRIGKIPSENIKLLAKDEINFGIRKELLFSAKEKDGYKLYITNLYLGKIECLTNKDYDKIIYKDDHTKLIKNNKTDIFYNGKVYELECDKLQYLNNNLAIYQSDSKTIIKDLEKNEVLLEDCEIIKYSDKTIAFKKNDKYGLLYKNSICYYFDGLESINKDSYIVTKNGKKGLFIKNCLQCDTEYDEIKCIDDERKVNCLSKDDHSVVMVALRKDSSWTLCRCYNDVQGIVTTEFISDNYDNIEFLDNIIVAYKNNQADVFDYMGEILTHDMTIHSIASCADAHTYLINGECYRLSGKMFKNDEIRNLEEYRGSCIFDDLKLEISSYHKQIFDVACNIMNMSQSILVVVDNLKIMCPDIKIELTTVKPQERKLTKEGGQL